MSWKKLLQSNSVHRHNASRQELSDIRRLVARDLADAAFPALSEDRRFATAYNAALQIAKMAIACDGYRVASVPGHHRLTFEGAKLSLGKQAEQLADYFDACRRKRNEIDYRTPRSPHDRGRPTRLPLEIISQNGGRMVSKQLTR